MRRAIAVGRLPGGKKGTGANDGDRTRDNRYHKPALYQLSYVRHSAGRGSRAGRPAASTGYRAAFMVNAHAARTLPAPFPPWGVSG